MDNVLKDTASVASFESLMSRGLIDPEALEAWRKVRS
jgi:hypothetical protein